MLHRDTYRACIPLVHQGHVRYRSTARDLSPRLAQPPSADSPRIIRPTTTTRSTLVCSDGRSARSALDSLGVTRST